MDQAEATEVSALLKRDPLKDILDLGILVERCSVLEFAIRQTLVLLIDNDRTGPVLAAGHTVDRMVIMSRDLVNEYKAANDTAVGTADELTEILKALDRAKEVMGKRNHVVHGFHSRRLDGGLLFMRSKMGKPQVQAQEDASADFLPGLIEEVGAALTQLMKALSDRSTTSAA